MDPNPSPCCNEPWHWEQIQGMRLYHEEGKRKFYKVRCPKCGRSAEVDAKGAPV